MTNYETPFDRQAHLLGISPTALMEAIDAVQTDMDTLHALGRPDVDPEYRDLVAANDIHPSQWEA